MLEKIDSFVLAGCTKFSHWLQRLTGLTNYFVANIGVGLAAVAVMIIILNYFHQILSGPTTLFYAIINLVVLAFLLGQSLTCMKAQEKISNGKVALPKEIKVLMSDYPLRLLTLAVAIFFTITIFWGPLSKSPQGRIETLNDTVFGWGYCIFIYFTSVIPLPPGISKLRKFLDNLASLRGEHPIHKEN